MEPPVTRDTAALQAWICHVKKPMKSDSDMSTLCILGGTKQIARLQVWHGESQCGMKYSALTSGCRASIPGYRSSSQPERASMALTDECQTWHSCLLDTLKGFSSVRPLWYSKEHIKARITFPGAWPNGDNCEWFPLNQTRNCMCRSYAL